MGRPLAPPKSHIGGLEREGGVWGGRGKEGCGVSIQVGTGKGLGRDLAMRARGGDERVRERGGPQGRQAN